MMISLVCLLLVLVPGGRDKESPVFACNLGALTKDERATHGRLAEALLAAVAERRELANGYGFRLPAAELETASRWVALESRCCPFFSFELRLAAQGGPLWLHITGPEGVKPFMRAEFGL